MDLRNPIDTQSAIWSDNSNSKHNPATLLDLKFTEVANVLALESSLLIYSHEQDRLLSGVDLQDGLGTDMHDEKGFKENSWAPCLLSKAKEVDSSLALWPETIPPSWLPRIVSSKTVPPSVRDAGLYDKYCHVYPDVLVATTWNEWRSARLKVLALIARYQPEDLVTASIQRLVDDICASVPFLLGDRIELTPMYLARNIYPSAEGQPLPKGHHQNAAAFGGWYILTPLRETTKVATYLREGQLDWVLGQMKRLAGIYGVTPEE